MRKEVFGLHINQICSTGQCLETYFVKSVCWLIATKMVFEPKLQRMHHGFQWKQNRRLDTLMARRVVVFEFPNMMSIISERITIPPRRNVRDLQLKEQLNIVSPLLSEAFGKVQIFGRPFHLL